MNRLLGESPLRCQEQQYPQSSPLIYTQQQKPIQPQQHQNQQMIEEAQPVHKPISVKLIKIQEEPIQKMKQEAVQIVPPEKPFLRSPRPNKALQSHFHASPLVSEDSITPSNTSSSIISGTKGTFPCHCSKTHCLKLYCSCFHNNRVCTPLCACVDCHNVVGYQNERKEAVDFVRSKGVRAHEIDKFDTTQIWGCKCRKTHCVKRYCECFIRGKKCTTHCKCEVCDNKRPPNIKKKIKHN